MYELIEYLLALPKEEFINWCIVTTILFVVLIVGLTEFIKTIFFKIRGGK
jgi:hypothetical protein